MPVPSLPQGVRSISFLDHLLSVGSGNGYVSVWDRRAGAYLQSIGSDSAASALSSRACSADLDVYDAHCPAAEPPSEPLALELAGGYLEENEVYECVSSAPFCDISTTAPEAVRRLHICSPRSRPTSRDAAHVVKPQCL